MSILIICPSRGRPKELARMIQSFLATSSVAELVIRADDDQKAVYAEVPTGARVSIEYGPRIGPGASIQWSAYQNMRLAQDRNQAILKPYEAFCAAPDDAEFMTPGWDLYALEVLKSFPGRIGVVSAAHDQGGFLNYPCVSKEWIEVLGWYAHPTIYHFCWDTMHEMLGDATNIVYAPKDKWFMKHQGLPPNIDHYPDDTSGFLTWCVTERAQCVQRLRAAIARANERDDIQLSR